MKTADFENGRLIALPEREVIGQIVSFARKPGAADRGPIAITQRNTGDLWPIDKGEEVELIARERWRFLRMICFQPAPAPGETRPVRWVLNRRGPIREG